MALQEYRFRGLASDGQTVQGTLFATSRRNARQKADAFALRHRIRDIDLKRRRVYLYKARHTSGQIVTGEQKAFSAEEISLALTRMGLEDVRVQKKLISYQPRPPHTDLIMFVRLSANLLREKLPFDEILRLLIGDVSSMSLRQVIRDLHADLKGGTDAQQAFMKHQHMLGKFTAYMLGIASRSGNMAEIYEATARFLERKDEFRKSVRSAMITPAITIIALIAAFVWYIWYIFPQTAGLFEELGIELPPMTAKTLAFSRWLDANFPWVLITGTGLGIAAVAFTRSTRGRFILHRYMIRLPIVGPLLHKLNIEIFCRVFSVLYSGSGDNIRVIEMAAEACGNTYMEHRIKTVAIPMMVAQGADLVRAMKASEVFTSMTIARLRSGSETGNVRGAARQMADYYEKETTLKLKAAVEGIQTAVAIIITIAICFLTVISSEIALVQPSPHSIGGF